MVCSGILKRSILSARQVQSYPSRVKCSAMGRSGKSGWQSFNERRAAEKRAKDARLAELLAEYRATKHLQHLLHRSRPAFLHFNIYPSTSHTVHRLSMLLNGNDLLISGM
jgi:hypothetical protein